jgi:hypothetical protein
VLSPFNAGSRKLFAGGIAFLCLTLGTAIYFATRPAATLSAIQAALAANDYRALNALVDFPALRASVKADLQRELQSRAGLAPSTAMQFGAAIGNLLIGPMVDLVVSPLGLSYVLEGYSLGTSAGNAQSPGAEANPCAAVLYDARWESLSQYAVSVYKDGKPVSILMLRRYGWFDWKLAGVNSAPSS